jgi:hypothetical protein
MPPLTLLEHSLRHDGHITETKRFAQSSPTNWEESPAPRLGHSQPNRWVQSSHEVGILGTPSMNSRRPIGRLISRSHIRHSPAQLFADVPDYTVDSHRTIGGQSRIPRDGQNLHSTVALRTCLTGWYCPHPNYGYIIHRPAGKDHRTHGGKIPRPPDEHNLRQMRAKSPATRWTLSEHRSWEQSSPKSWVQSKPTPWEHCLLSRW